MTVTDHRPPDAFELDWGASWIAPVEGDDLAMRQRPVQQLATAFVIDGEVASATLHVTAHGIYEAFVNGTRVGDVELTPGWTAYRSRLQVQSFEVGELLVAGENVVGALLSDGWWRGQNSVARRVDDYGATTALLAQLEVAFADGRTASPGPGPTTTRRTGASRSWSLEGASLTVDVTVPGGTEAALHAPDGSAETLGAGDHRRTWTVPDPARGSD